MRLLLAFVLTAVTALASDVKLIRVWPEYRTAASFQRISEFFTGRENSSGQTLLRSQPDAREGFYFLIRTAAAVPVDATLELQVVKPGSDQVHTANFPARLPAGSHVTLAGLTGADWPNAATEPTAWRLRILDATGAPLAESQSYLWSLPAK